MTRRTLLQGGAFALAAPAATVRLPRPVRVALLGLEGHYSEVLEAAKEVPQIRIVAVATTKPREADRLAKNPALAKTKHYDDYRRLLDSEKPDAVCICNENHLRASAILACAERGVAIAAEKPLATSLADLDAVKKAVTRHKVPLTMLLPMRFEPHFLAMRSIVASGQIGEPLALGAQKSYKLGLARGQRPDWMRKRATYGGTIPYIGIHMVDLMRFTSGREFVEAAAFHSTAGLPELGELENNTAIIYRLDNRGTANLRMDYLRPEAAPTHGDDRLRLAGTKGVVEYQGGTVTLTTANEAPRPITDLPSHPSLFSDFLDSIYNGKKPLLPPEDVYRVTEIVLRTRDAADANRVVKL
jgi:predicted dehydrogenase